MSTPPKNYTAPGYVSAFTIAGLLCVILGLVALFMAISNEQSPWSAVGLLIAGFANFLYAQIADAIARTNWRVEQLAWQLHPVIVEANRAIDLREKAERAAASAREAEIRRVVESRLSAAGETEPD